MSWKQRVVSMMQVIMKYIENVPRKFRERESYVSRSVRFQMREFSSPLRCLSTDVGMLHNFEWAGIYHPRITSCASSVAQHAGIAALQCDMSCLDVEEIVQLCWER